MYVCVILGLGVQNLDTKGVPAASDEDLNAARVGALSGRRCCRDKWKDTRIDLLSASDSGRGCLNLTCSSEVN